MLQPLVCKYVDANVVNSFNIVVMVLLVALAVQMLQLCFHAVVVPVRFLLFFVLGLGLLFL